MPFISVCQESWKKINCDFDFRSVIQAIAHQTVYDPGIKINFSKNLKNNDFYLSLACIYPFYVFYLLKLTKNAFLHICTSRPHHSGMSSGHH